MIRTHNYVSKETQSYVDSLKAYKQRKLDRKKQNDKHCMEFGLTTVKTNL